MGSVSPGPKAPGLQVCMPGSAMTKPIKEGFKEVAPLLSPQVIIPHQPTGCLQGPASQLFENPCQQKHPNTFLIYFPLTLLPTGFKAGDRLFREVQLEPSPAERLLCYPFFCKPKPHTH